MKKLIPIIMFSIILFCTACEKAVNPIDMYDNVTYNSTIEELKEIHKNDNNFQDHGNSFSCTSKNTVLQSIAEKYNAEESRITVKKFSKNEDLNSVINIIVTVKALNVTEEDFKTITNIFDNKYKNTCYEKEIMNNKADFYINDPNLWISIKNNNDNVNIVYSFGLIFNE